MKSFRTTLVLVWLLFVVTGCSIRSSQLSSMIGLVRGAPADFSDSTWVIRYGDYRAQVQAIPFEGGTLFSNSLRDQAFFDGWTITRASGLGLKDSSWGVKDDTEGRHFTREGRLSTYPACGSWVKTSLAEVTQFAQSCQGAVLYKNNILVNQLGEIALIRQSLNGGASFVTLRKL